MVGLRVAVVAATLLVARMALGAGAVAKLPLPVEEHGGNTVAVTEGVGGDAVVEFTLALHNTGAEEILVAPTFASAARIDKVEVPSYRISTFERETGGTATAIAPNAVALFHLPLTGLDAAGIYAVEALFGDAKATYQLHATKLVVYRRESGWHAALAILLGAVLAWGIRVYISDGSRRLALRRRIALLEAQLRTFRRAARGEDLVVAARVLELDVLDRERDVRWGGNKEAISEEITRAELRFALLQDVAAAIERLVRIDADKQIEARKVLEDALAVVRVDSPDRLAIDAARDRVGKLGLTALIREQLRGWLADLEIQLAAPNNVDPAVLAEVAATVSAARDFLRTSALDELEAAIRKGRAQLLDASIAALEALIEAPPLGVTTGWTATAARIRAKLQGAVTSDWADRKRAFQEAQALYFEAAVPGLAAEARRRAGAGDSRGERLQAIAQDLTEIAAKDPMLAAPRYAAVLAEVSAPDPAAARTVTLLAGTLRGHEGTEEAAELEVPPPAGWIPFVPGDLTAGVWKPTPMRTLDRMISSSRWLVNLGVMVIAVATGVKVLWLDNLSWGGQGAWLIGFLWGSGVQLTGDTCVGFLGLRSRLAGVTPV